jgi:hypothetical protein
MKKIIILLITISLLIFGCSNKKTNNIDNKIEEEEEVIEKTPPFVDNNPIKIGFYEYTNYGRNLLTKYTTPWVLGKDIVVLEVFPTNNKVISSNYIQYTWKEYWDKYNNIYDYKIVYFIRFQLNNGDIIEQMILKPSDAMLKLHYIYIYLYDDIHQPIGAWYSHLEDKDIKKDTLFTSIKIFAAEEIDKIISPIELMVFTYNGKDDFDYETNTYLGNSSYTITINKSN